MDKIQTTDCWVQAELGLDAPDWWIVDKRKNIPLEKKEEVIVLTPAELENIMVNFLMDFRVQSQADLAVNGDVVNFTGTYIKSLLP